MKKAVIIDTPIGVLAIAEENEKITNLFLDAEKLPAEIKIEETALLVRAKTQLEEYFLGKRKKFDLPINPKGTDFQQKVWKNLVKIPYGKTWTYKELAEESGNVKACRAVGGANNKNPIAIFVPCHRVIGADGKLVGYAGGLSVKQKLLELEAKYN